MTNDTSYMQKTLDVSVLMLFHARPDHFSKVWAEVRKARPARLFLYQDGPREGKNDMPGILACRSLVADENIDWQCEVHRNYQERNYGCDPSGFMSQRWAFSLTDKCIVLEDDVVPSQSFFTFCKEMLDRYENDERITMVAGFNVSKPSRNDSVNSDAPSYFFTRAFSIWGWASWARVVNNWDEHYDWLDSPSDVEKIERMVEKHHLRKDMLPMCRAHKAQGKAFYETIFWAYKTLHEGLAIMPARNMVNNLGNEAEESTHYAGTLKCMPRDLRMQFTMRRFEIDFPLRHPSEVKEDTGYKDRLYRRNAWGHPWIKVMHSLEELMLNLRYGNFRFIKDAMANRARILIRQLASPE